MTGTTGFVLETNTRLRGHIFEGILRGKQCGCSAKHSRDGNRSQRTEKRAAIDLRRQAIAAPREQEEVFCESIPHIFLQDPRFLTARTPE